MKKLKTKSLVVLGIALSFLMIFVLAYATWKTLFYAESDQYGISLSKELLFGARLGNTEIPDSSLLSKGKFSLESFDYFPKGFLNRIDPGIVKNGIQCGSMTDIHSLFFYSASVKCRIAGRDIHYFFDKRYDHPAILLLIIGIAAAAVIGVVRFFIYVGRLQDQNLQKTLPQKNRFIELSSRANSKKDKKYCKTIHFRYTL